jgi:hypothetical protein
MGISSKLQFNNLQLNFKWSQIHSIAFYAQAKHIRELRKFVLIFHGPRIVFSQQETNRKRRGMLRYLVDISPINATVMFLSNMFPVNRAGYVEHLEHSNSRGPYLHLELSIFVHIFSVLSHDPVPLTYYICKVGRRNAGLVYIYYNPLKKLC